MANLQHDTLPSASVHEPKHISLNSTSATGNVITNSSSVASTSEYRRLVQQDIDELEQLWIVLELDASVAQTHYIPATYAGTIEKWAGIITGTAVIATGSNTYELQIDGVQVTSSPITFTTGVGTGGAAGDIVKATATSANVFAEDAEITVVNTAANNTDANCDIRFVIACKRIG